MDPRTKFRGEVNLRHGATAAGLLLPDAAAPNVAYVQTLGNDGTGVIGDPFRPFATLLAAYSAGARVFDLGVGTFDGMTVTSLDIMLMGKGRTQTIVGNIEGTSGNVFGNGRENITVGSVSIICPDGDDAPDGSGGNGGVGTSCGDVLVRGLYLNGDAILSGGTGGRGGRGADTTSEEAPPGVGGTGGAGGSAGTLTLEDCTATGYGVSVAGDGGRGGDGGDSLDTSTTGGNGGNSGAAGAQGSLVLLRSFVGGMYVEAAQPGGTGPGGTGMSDGNPGTAGATAIGGTVTTLFSNSATDGVGVTSSTYRASMIAGVWNA